MDGEQDTVTVNEADRDEDGYADSTDDSQWYRGKAREDHKKRLRATEERGGGEEDPIQVRYIQCPHLPHS